MGEHVAVNFNDGFCLGEVMQLNGNSVVKVSLMKSETVGTASREHRMKFWIWPYSAEVQNVHMDSFLRIIPANLDLDIPPSTNKLLVFSLGNTETLERLAISET